jgi:hypothetical protein
MHQLNDEKVREKDLENMGCTDVDMMDESKVSFLYRFKRNQSFFFH